MYSLGDTCEETKVAKYVYQPVIAWLYAFDELLVLLRQNKKFIKERDSFLEILFENHVCEKVYLNKDHNHHLLSR